MEWVVGEKGKGRSRLRAEQTRRWTRSDEGQYASHPHAKKLMCDLIFR